MPVEDTGAYLREIAGGDRDAMRGLFAIAAPPLNGMLIALLRDTVAADAVLEDLFARLPLKLRDHGELALDDSLPAGLWLELLARGLALNRLRREEERDFSGKVPQIPSIGGSERLVPAAWGHHLSAAQTRGLLRAWYRGLSYAQLARLANEDQMTFRAALAEGLAGLESLPLELPASASGLFEAQAGLTAAERLAACEFTLGLAPGSEWFRLRQRFRLDPGFRAAAMLWALRFTPFDAGITALPPRPDLLARIEARIEADRLPALQSAASLEPVSRGRSPLFLSLGMLTGIGVVASLFGALVMLPPSSAAAPSAGISFMPLSTLLVAPGGAPVFEARYDPVSGLLRVNRSQGPWSGAVEGRSYELWLAAPGARQRSLGVIGGEGLALPIVLSPGMTLAVSLEPQGGSPLWGPSGQVISAAILNPQ